MSKQLEWAIRTVKACNEMGIYNLNPTFKMFYHLAQAIIADSKEEPAKRFCSCGEELN